MAEKYQETRSALLEQIRACRDAETSGGKGRRHRGAESAFGYKLAKYFQAAFFGRVSKGASV